MKHIRNDHNVSISGSLQKIQLRNIGYYHGYKGYRFYKIGKSEHRFNTNSFKDIYSVFLFDSQLKSIFYKEIMYIETALKNITLDEILKYSNTCDTNKINKIIFDISSNTNMKKKSLGLISEIDKQIVNAYTKNPKVDHFLNKKQAIQIPYWAIFDVITFGTFGLFLECLTLSLRKSISDTLSVSYSYDTKYDFLNKIVYFLKDLRNAVAHNMPIFDVRFKTKELPSHIKQYLSKELNLFSMNFDNIFDYFALIIFLNKKISSPRKHQKELITQFKNEIDSFRKNASQTIISPILIKDIDKKN